MTDAEKLLVLNDFFRWSGGELPASDGQILIYLECSYPFEGFDEDEVVACLRTEIIRNGEEISDRPDDGFFTDFRYPERASWRLHPARRRLCRTNPGE